MIIPINSGRSITPIYIPQPVSTNTGVLEQSSTSTQSSEPPVWAWVALGVAVIFLIVFIVYFIKVLKDLIKDAYGDEE